MPAVLGVIQTHAAHDRDAAKKLRRLQDAVTDRAHAAVRVWERLEDVEAEPRWELRREALAARKTAVRPEDGERAERDASGEYFDANQPGIDPRKLLYAELLFVVVEVFFWYGLFSYGYGSKYGPLSPERVGAVLLGLVIPVVGVVVARVVGFTGHRWLMNYEGISRRRHLGAVLGVVVLVLVCLAIFQLVLFRFGAAGVLGPKVPAWAMALLFVLFLVADTAMRLLLVSEVRAQYDRQAGDFDRLRRAVIKANTEHTTAWTALRSLVQQHRDEATRVEVVGAHLVFEGRARWDDPERTVRPRQTRRPHQDNRNGGRRSAMALPADEPLHLLGEDLPLGTMPVLADAIDVLRHWPPLDQDQLSARLRDMWLRVQGRERPQAGAPRHNGHPGPTSRHRPGDPTVEFTVVDPENDDPRCGRS
ncbi:hypothetical protein ABZ816_39980 [Actinosynnema sp. NPDC047251]|nr:hypothetical protein [Saccharothrix espanaensis]